MVPRIVVIGLLLAGIWTKIGGEAGAQPISRQEARVEYSSKGNHSAVNMGPSWLRHEELARAFLRDLGAAPAQEAPPGLRALIAERFVRVPLGAFEVVFPAVALQDKEHADEFQRICEALVQAEQRWFEWMSPEGERAARASSASRPWPSGWRAGSRASSRAPSSRGAESSPSCSVRRIQYGARHARSPTTSGPRHPGTSWPVSCPCARFQQRLDSVVGRERAQQVAPGASAAQAAAEDREDAALRVGVQQGLG